MPPLESSQTSDAVACVAEPRSRACLGAIIFWVATLILLTVQAPSPTSARYAAFLLAGAAAALLASPAGSAPRVAFTAFAAWSFIHAAASVDLEATVGPWRVDVGLLAPLAFLVMAAVASPPPSSAVAPLHWMEWALAAGFVLAAAPGLVFHGRPPAGLPFEALVFALCFVRFSLLARAFPGGYGRGGVVWPGGVAHRDRRYVAGSGEGC